MAFLFLVFGNQRREGFPGLGGQDLPHPREPNLFDRPAGFAAAPGVKGGQLGEQRGPIGFGEGSLVSQQGFDGVRI